MDTMDKGVHSYYIYQLDELGIISRIKRGLLKWEEYDFGDIIVPKPRVIEYPIILEMESIKVSFND